MNSFNGLNCPKCGKLLTRKGRKTRCRCGYTHYEEEDKFEKAFIYGSISLPPASTVVQKGSKK